MISDWHGNWGVDGLPGVPHNDSPPSPAYRKVHSSPNINIWNDPKGFNNYYRKLKSYPDGEPAHDETYIP